MANQVEPHFKLRLPPTTKEWLRGRAKQNCRSISSEILFRLESDRLSEAAEAGSSGEAAAGQPTRA